jgi:predicted lipoprotein with Yx(FWY)xxD motif
MTLSKSRSVTYAVAAAALATIAAGCGSSSSGGNQALQPAGGGSTSSAHTTGLTTRSTSLGTVVADSKGNTVYELVGNPASNSKCSAACMAIWPPVMSGGKIAVVHGHPVFTYTGDSSAGQTNGQGLTDTWGKWLALDTQGQPVAGSGGGSATTPSSAPSSASGGGGYGY